MLFSFPYIPSFKSVPKDLLLAPSVRPCKCNPTSPGSSNTVPFSFPERFLTSSELLFRLSSPWSAIPPLFPGQLLTFAFIL